MDRPTGEVVIQKARFAPFVLLGALLVGCGGGPAGVIRGPVPGFHPGWMIDVAGPDAVRAVSAPTFEPVSAAHLLDPDPVLALAVGDLARAYPLAILERHEVVDDVLGGRPLAVTYSPLSNTAVVLQRTLDNGKPLTLAPAGKIYLSDAVLYDRETTSLWTQFDGRAVAGELRGVTLAALPSEIVSFGDFRRAYPGGQVLRAPGPADYSYSAYPGYDGRRAPYPDLFLARIDGRLPVMQRIVGVSLDGVTRAYPYDALRARGDPVVVTDRLGKQDVVVFFGGDTRSPLDAARVQDSHSVGGSGVFAPIVNGKRASFSVRDGAIVDAATRSTWSLLGRAVDGPLKGRQLPQVQHLDAFWFAWAGFFPGSDIWGRPAASGG